MSAEQVTLLKNTVAKGASDDELKLFLTIANKHRLDPFVKQIHFVRRWDRNADSGKRTPPTAEHPQGEPILGAYVGTTQIGIDGFRAMAARDHADYGSTSKPVFGEMRTVEYTYTYKNKSYPKKLLAPESASVKVHKIGVAFPTEAEVYWDELAPKRLQDAPFWTKMPRHMLGKCAEAHALRKAYPDMSGLYIPEELEATQQDVTAAGRQIVRRQRGGRIVDLAEATAKRDEEANPYLRRYEEREKEELEKLRKEEAAKADKGTGNPNERAGGSAHAGKAPIAPSATDAAASTNNPVPCLFYRHFPESGTWQIDGPKELLHAQRDILVSLWNDTARAIVCDAKQLGHLIRQCEERKVPIRAIQ